MEIRVTGVVISLWVTSLSRTVASLRKYGKNFDNDPLTMHRIIWYQFMYHIDCEIPIPEKSNVWTMQFSHTFSKWKSIKFSIPMDTERETNDWIAVGAPRRGRNKSPPAPDSNTPPGANNDLVRKQPGTMYKLVKNRKSNPNPQLSMKKDWSRYQKLVKPASRPPQVSTAHEDDNEDAVPIKDDGSTQLNSASIPGTSTNRPSSFPTIAVNDGTHRVTLKWSVHDGLKQYNNDKGTLTKDIQHLLRTLFTDMVGLIYHWQDKDLNRSASFPTYLLQISKNFFHRQSSTRGLPHRLSLV